MRGHLSSCLSNPKEMREPASASAVASDEEQELGWAIGKARFRADEVVGDRQYERGARKAEQVGSQVERQNCRQMVLHSAALIARIAGSVPVTIVLKAVIDMARSRDVVGKGDLALASMLEVNGKERRNANNLRKEIKPHDPWDHQPYFAWRLHTSRLPNIALADISRLLVTRVLD